MRPPTGFHDESSTGNCGQTAVRPAGKQLAEPHGELVAECDLGAESRCPAGVRTHVCGCAMCVLTQERDFRWGREKLARP